MIKVNYIDTEKDKDETALYNIKESIKFKKID